MLYTGMDTIYLIGDVLMYGGLVLLGPILLFWAIMSFVVLPRTIAKAKKAAQPPTWYEALFSPN